MKAIQTGPIGANTWIVPLAENFVFIVDPAGRSVTGDETAITDYLESHSLNPVAVILTHGHFDHVIGLPVIKEKYPKIKIAIHKDDSEYIGKNSQIVQEKCLAPLGATGFIPYLSNLPEADFFLEDSCSLEKYFTADYCTKICGGNSELGEKVCSAFGNWLVLHTPGHTTGSVCLYNQKEKMLISGDTIFFRSQGRTDLYGGSDADMAKSLAKIKKIVLPDTLVFPGHDYSGFCLSENL